MCSTCSTCSTWSMCLVFIHRVNDTTLWSWSDGKKRCAPSPSTRASQSPMGYRLLVILSVLKTRLAPRSNSDVLIPITGPQMYSFRLQANPDCEVQELSRRKLRTVHYEAPFEDKQEDYFLNRLDLQGLYSGENSQYLYSKKLSWNFNF